uniref:Suaeda glauca hydrogen peroxide-induced protein mRNA n=1 Tax=Suaeda glauca TaxID=397272 RepID=A0A0C5AWH2_9CARY|nr:hydrogen peroxide-induced protein [Suaeda glauca]
MAANSSSRGVKQFVSQIITHTSSSSSSTRALSSAPIFRRSLHGSVYDKNVDEHVRPAVVPDDVINPQSDKYWAPNPNTGVFGPAAEQNAATGVDGFRFHSTASNASNESVLEQKTFFRPLEDLDKPQHP